MAKAGVPEVRSLFVGGRFADGTASCLCRRSTREIQSSGGAGGQGEQPRRSRRQRRPWQRGGATGATPIPPNPRPENPIASTRILTRTPTPTRRVCRCAGTMIADRGRNQILSRRNARLHLPPAAPVSGPVVRNSIGVALPPREAVMHPNGPAAAPPPPIMRNSACRPRCGAASDTKSRGGRDEPNDACERYAKHHGSNGAR